MLEDTRIKEAEANVRNYLDSGMLKKITKPDIIVKNVLIRNSKESLKVAGLKADEIISSFDYERVKRSRIQYDTGEEAKKSKAETSFNRAKEFVFEISKIAR